MRQDVAAFLLTLVATTLYSEPLKAQSTTCTSVSSAGAPCWADNRSPFVTGDGRYVLFDSLADQLYANDGNATFDVFVHDRQTGVTECVSLDPAGLTGNGASEPWAISADGRIVMFASYATSLGPPDGNGLADMFVRDRQTGAIEMVSVDSAGVQGNKASSIGGGLSADGQYAVFSSFSSNLGGTDANNTWDVFLRDRVAGTTVCVSVTTAGATGSAASQYCAISADGRFVAFDSDANNLTTDTSIWQDIFVRDMQTGTTTLVSKSSTGAQANSHCSFPSISADGRYVVFTSLANNLVTGDTNGANDVFVRDRATLTTQRASLSELGLEFSPGSLYGSISGDGGFVAFVTRSANVVAGDGNNAYDVFVRDLAAGTTVRASVSSGGTEGDGDSGSASIPVLSTGAQLVVFESYAATLTANDANGFADVFVREGQSMCAPIVAFCTAKVNGQGCVPWITSAGQPQLSGEDAFLLVGANVLAGKNGYLFWGASAASIPFGGGIVCVQPPLERTDLQNSFPGASPGVCDGAYTFHFSQAYMAQKGVVAGVPLYCQYWSRDPAFAPPDNVGLTDALQFVPCP